MDLDRLQVVLRKRGVHESIDLGLRIHQRWAGPVYRVWLATVVPAWLLILGATWAIGQLWLGVLLVWWLKPLWERVPLFVVSRAIFGATPSLRDVFRALPRLWSNQLAADLLLYRFSPARALLMPVGQLEGQTGSRRSKRRRVLGRGEEGSGAFALMIGGLGLETLLGLGAIQLVLLMLPDIPQYSAASIFDDAFGAHSSWWSSVGPVAAWLAAMSVIEPIFVASGFALYINRRTALEGWDVELSFRRLAARISHRIGTRSASRIAGLLVVLLSMTAASPAFATDANNPADTPVDNQANDLNEPIHSADHLPEYLDPAAAPVDTVLTSPQFTDATPGPDPETAGHVNDAAAVIFARPEFGYERTTYHWEPRDLPTFGGVNLDPLVAWMEWLLLSDEPWYEGWFDGHEDSESSVPEGWSMGASGIYGEVFVWAAVGVLLSLGAMFMWRRRSIWSLPRSRPRPQLEDAPEMGALVGPRVVAAPSSTIPDKVWHTWRRGEADAALSLLYNAALAELSTDRDLELEDAWTEGDCARAVRKQVGGDAAKYFQQVVRARTRIAYAHRPPEDADVKRLCEDWPRLRSSP